MHLPSELEAMVVIPELRAMLARELAARRRMSQNEIALLLGVSQPAISNYISGVRGTAGALSSSPYIRLRISEMAEDPQCLRDSTSLAVCLNELIDFIRRNRLMCELHRRLDTDLEIDSCHMCDG
ncbi:MAG: helix-turn-helix domain-containing protein [Methanomassiliicoccales archaeon]